MDSEFRNRSKVLFISKLGFSFKAAVSQLFRSLPVPATVDNNPKLHASLHSENRDQCPDKHLQMRAFQCGQIVQLCVTMRFKIKKKNSFRLYKMILELVCVEGIYVQPINSVHFFFVFIWTELKNKRLFTNKQHIGRLHLWIHCLKKLIKRWVYF